MKRVILDYNRARLILIRMSHQLVEQHGDFSNTVLIAMQPRGILLGKAIKSTLNELFNISVQYGELDTTFHRDDFRRTDKPLIPNVINIDFAIEKKRVVLVDDALYT